MANDNYRSIEAEMRMLSGESEYIVPVELWCLNGEVNRNGWRYTNMKGHKDDFCGTPILTAYTNKGRRIGDGHNFDMTIDTDTMESVPTFVSDTSERIIGCMSEKPSDMRIEVDDSGKEWVVCKGFLWMWYAREAVKKIKDKTAKGEPMSISIETLVTRCHQEDGIEVEDEYTILGTTVLGDGVNPAVESAKIVALQELTGELKELKLRAASYIEPEKGNTETNINPDGSEEKAAQIKINKGVKTLKALSKRQLKELSSKFDGYKVLAGRQSDNGTHVVLLSEDGSTALYTMESLDETVIVPTKIQKINATVSFDVDSEEPITADFYACAEDMQSVIDARNNEIENRSAELENKTAEIVRLQNTISRMRASELKRRVAAAKAMAHATLEKFNSNREEKVSAAVLSEIVKRIENGEFSECGCGGAKESADGECGCGEGEECECGCGGEWTGEQEVCNAVLAACAIEVMKMDEASAELKKNSYVWDKVGGKARKDDNGDVASLLATFEIE